MKNVSLLIVAFILLSLNGNAQVVFELDNYEESTLSDAELLVGEELPPGGYDGINETEVHDEISDVQRNFIWANIKANTAKLKAKGIIPETPMAFIPGDGFRYPLKLSVGDFVYNWNAFYWNSNFVDENPAAGAISDYNCGTRTYDIPGYNHKGQDIALWPFSWNLVAGNYAQVVAAAGGWITFKQDGNFDMNCGFGGGDWNAVYLEHEDGSITWYGHMKNGSLTVKPVGAWVNRGEYLGVVASSGQSTGPHLHFEIYDNLGNLVDPNAGPCNFMGGVNWWKDPKAYYYSKINAIYTHCLPPTFMACPNLDITNICNVFYPGSLVYFYNYFTETLAGQHAFYQIYKPDGSLFTQWNYTFPLSYLASYWYWSFTLPAGNLGTWTYIVKFKGKTLTYYFSVINPLKSEGIAERVGDQNHIYWMNSGQLDNAEFEIETSLNKMDAKTIASFPGASIAEKPIYQYFHDDPYMGTNYYRIKTNYDNGQSILSEWMAVDNARTSQIQNAYEKVYPIPANEFVNIISEIIPGSEIDINIYNAAGQIIQSETSTADLENLIRLNISDLDSGIYLAEILSNSGRFVYKFVKQ